MFFMFHTTIKPTCPVSTAFTLKDDTTPQVAVATKLERMKGKKEGKMERDEHDRLGVEAGDNSETTKGRECCVGHSIKKGRVAIKDSTPERVGEGSSEERVSRACNGGARGPDGIYSTIMSHEADKKQHLRRPDGPRTVLPSKGFCVCIRCVLLHIDINAAV